MLSIIVLIIGIVLWVTFYSLTKNFFNKQGEKENIVENENNFVLKMPKAKVKYNTLILLFWVIIFALYMNGLIFNKSIIWTVLFLFIIVVTFIRTQKSINKKIVINGDIIIDPKGVSHYFTEFTDCNVVNNGAVLFSNGEPIISIEKDNIGYDLFLEKIKNSNISFHDGRK